jgi:hypothetical protein
MLTCEKFFDDTIADACEETEEDTNNAYNPSLYHFVADHCFLFRRFSPKCDKKKKVSQA